MAVTADSAFQKGYLKILTKEYLMKCKLRNWIRVAASAEDTYELRYTQKNKGDEKENEKEV